MFLVYCPYCDAKKPEIEFTHAGEAHIARPSAAQQAEMSDEDWSKYKFIRANVRGDHAERWWHSAGCNMFFNAVRDTVTDKFVMSYKMGQPRPTAATLTKAKAAKINTEAKS